MTALYPQIVYGPVHSRRLGVSLGVNLLPLHSKLCTFDCIYCECGWNDDNRGKEGFNSREDVAIALESRLIQMSADGVLPDVITFAGNGEPTLHPDFEGVIEDTIALRDKYAPNAKISVLSNATQLHRQDVVRALKRVDNNILKLDAAIDSTVIEMNKPCCHYAVEEVIDQLAAFDGNLIVQIMFLRGEYNGKQIDNTTPEHISALRKALERIRPKQIMCYTIARDTPCKTLEAVPADEIARLQAELGY